MFESKIDPKSLEELNADVKQRASVDREHILKFLTLIPTNDGEHIIKEVQQWLTNLHNDPSYDKISFRNNDIECIISDLDSYGHVSTSTLLKFKQENSRTVPMS